jgi:hypothetical protein
MGNGMIQWSELRVGCETREIGVDAKREVERGGVGYRGLFWSLGGFCFVLFGR